MFKKVFVAAAIVIASPAFVSAQDIFWSFSPTAFETNLDGGAQATGSAYIFSSSFFGFDAIDLNFTVGDPAVVRLTGGEAFNPTFNTIGGTRFDGAAIAIDSETNTGNLFLVNVIENGVSPNITQRKSVFDLRIEFLFDVAGASSHRVSVAEFSVAGSPRYATVRDAIARSTRGGIG